MNEIPARLARALYDCVCAFAIVAGTTTALLLYLEYGQLTGASRLALAATTLLVVTGFVVRQLRWRRRVRR